MSSPGVDMRRTCIYLRRMTSMIQVRNVPDALHRKLKARAALAGLSLSDFLLREMQVVAARPTPEEMIERLRRRSRVFPTVDPVTLIREARDRP